jgi:hypothetical protein
VGVCLLLVSQLRYLLLKVSLIDPLIRYFVFRGGLSIVCRLLDLVLAVERNRAVEGLEFRRRRFEPVN